MMWKDLFPLIMANPAGGCLDEIAPAQVDEFTPFKDEAQFPHGASA
jgi:hypothetical protein